MASRLKIQRPSPLFLVENIAEVFQNNFDDKEPFGCSLTSLYTAKVQYITHILSVMFLCLAKQCSPGSGSC